MEWSYQKFDTFSGREVYEILKLRVDVFIVEQDCAYHEIDNNDFDAIHISCKDESGITAYTRLLPMGVKYEEPSIGRVIVRKDVRGKGIAHELIERALIYILEKWEPEKIRLQAQSHLMKFYEKHGFKVTSSPYDDDGIPHVDMIYTASTHTNSKSLNGLNE